MKPLEGIKTATPCNPEATTGMTDALMTEIARHLAALALNGTETAIDLRSLPLSDADRQELEQRLGKGEVTAELQVAGASEVWETRFAGAWWIRHRGAGGQVSSEEIEICQVPEILKAHPADIAESAQRLAKENEE